MSRVVMVRRHLDSVLRVGMRLEPWGTVTSINWAYDDPSDNFTVVVVSDEGIEVGLVYRKDSIYEVMIISDDQDMEKAINLAAYVVSESQRLDHSDPSSILRQAGLGI